MYSLVSATVLGYDLVRLPAGAGLARLLRTALALGPADVPVLAEAAVTAGGTAGDRAEAWVEVASALPRLVRTDEALAAAAGSIGTPGGSRAALGVLQRATVGHVDGLVGLVRHDVLDWTWQRADGVGVQSEPASLAAGVVADAAVAAWTEGVVDPAVTATLRAPWGAVEPVLPPPAVSAGPCAAAVEPLLVAAAAPDAAAVARLQEVSDRQRLGDGDVPPLDWPRAVHAATWAVHVTDRVREAAVAQLRLVEALHPVVPVAALATGTWGVLSGAAQALTVADLLDTATLDGLAAPVLAALEVGGPPRG